MNVKDRFQFYARSDFRRETIHMCAFKDLENRIPSDAHRVPRWGVAPRLQVIVTTLHPKVLSVVFEAPCIPCCVHRMLEAILKALKDARYPDHKSSPAPPFNVHTLVFFPIYSMVKLNVWMSICSFPFSASFLSICLSLLLMFGFHILFSVSGQDARPFFYVSAPATVAVFPRMFREEA